MNFLILLATVAPKLDSLVAANWAHVVGRELPPRARIFTSGVGLPLGSMWPGACDAFVTLFGDPCASQSRHTKSAPRFQPRFARSQRASEPLSDF
jgi:hypothetical protein